MKLMDAINESKFGKFDVTDYSQIISKYRKLLQSYLTANNGGKLHGLIGGWERGTITLIGERVTVTLNMATLKVEATSLIFK